MKKGLLIYAIVDAFVELLFGILFVLIKIPVLGFWPFLMIIIDIVLAIGEYFVIFFKKFIEHFN